MLWEKHFLKWKSRFLESNLPPASLAMLVNPQIKVFLWCHISVDWWNHRLLQFIICLKKINDKDTSVFVANHPISVRPEFILLDKVFCVVADNVSSNGTMANALEDVFSKFKKEENLLGCVSHVINIIDWDRLKVFSERHGEVGHFPGNLDFLLELIQTSDFQLVLNWFLKLITWIYKLHEHSQSILE